MKVEGLDEAIDEINGAVAGVKQESQAIFWEAGLKVLRLAMIELKGSVVTGNLRASGYARRPDGTDLRPDPEKLDRQQNEPIPGDRIGDIGVEVGFTAVYALSVHENLEGSRTPKFLERPVVRNKQAIIKLLRSLT